MPFSTWSSDSSAWSGNSYIWGNQTYSATATIAANVTQTDSGLAKYPSTATLAANSTLSGVGAFTFVAEAILALSSGQTSVANTIYVSSVTLGSTQSTGATGNTIFVESITFATNGTMTDTGNTKYPVSVTMTQVNLSKLNEEDAVFPRSLSMTMNSGMTGTGLLLATAVATLNTELGDFKTNINFEESATLAAKSGITSDSNFLWNDIAEDTGSTWTKVSDPDE